MQERFLGRTPEDLVAVREHYKVPRAAIARRMGTTATTLYRWETGRVREITPLMFARYETACADEFAAQLKGDAA